MLVNGRRIFSEKFMSLVIPAGTLGFDRAKTLSVDIFELGKVEETYRLKAITESHRHPLVFIVFNLMLPSLIPDMN